MYDGDYIERLFLFEKPLTSRFRKKYVEFLALEILQYCYGDFYKKFNVYDSPDLCDKERVVGIEVTEAVTIEEAQIKSEFVKYRLENDNSKKERRRQIIENNGGRVEKFGLSYPVKNSESEIVTFQNAIRKKMEKLSLYRSRGFKTLGLFIFYDEPPIPIKIELLKECFDQVLNEYLGEISVICQLPFGAISAYVNHYSSPKKEWNVGLTLGWQLFNYRFIE